jgi:hemolysin activation/secretion protein
MVVDALLKNENHAQLVLGSDTGLRGYQVNRFAGEKRWYFNLEQRALLYGSEFVNIGGVFFADMGHVYKESDLMDPRLLNTAVGMGLRFTSHKFGFPMARLDVGYGVSDRVLAISFGTNQYF